ncbi:hypothetical protein DSLPV1_022 [Dishui lake phycodnavirus 1]|uniref:hypothetical protein n=1 Tax=Dishui lake phycodnavirus 1 TaxID=2079134 RepID=UPI000CD6A4FA|nr:hypothetical protein C5Y57_gp022 [Dishui lake phycodnavirus 1]AUT18993.1 hypothetical protein DSLPV1_022 [Dishui lake phycodnavirus 1]
MGVTIDKSEAQSIGVQFCLCLCCFFSMMGFRSRFPPNQLTIIGTLVCCILSCLQIFALRYTVTKALEPDPEPQK